MGRQPDGPRDSERRARLRGARSDAKESWACVAVDNEMLWVDLLGLGAEWQGHVVMFEMPSPRLSRRDRHSLEGAIAGLSESLTGLSRAQRDRTVRLAMDAMESVRA